jgi:hypothetical protein
MSRYRMQDGAIVDTERASKSWEESRFHDGRNWISRATGEQWTHQTLYRSRKGRYWIEHMSDWQGSHPSAEWIDAPEAARWLLVNKHELPEDLAGLADEVME